MSVQRPLTKPPSFHQTLKTNLMLCNSRRVLKHFVSSKTRNNLRCSPEFGPSCSLRALTSGLHRLNPTGGSDTKTSSVKAAVFELPPGSTIGRNVLSMLRDSRGHSIQAEVANDAPI